MGGGSSPRSFVKGFREPYREVYKKWAEQAFGSLAAFQKWRDRNTACEAEISFSQHVWGTEQDRLSLFVNSRNQRFLAGEVTHSRVKVKYTWIFSAGG